MRLLPILMNECPRYNLKPPKPGLIVSLSFKGRLYRVRKQEVWTLIIANFNWRRRALKKHKGESAGGWAGKVKIMSQLPMEKASLRRREQ